jgi:hypothetical protein
MSRHPSWGLHRDGGDRLVGPYASEVRAALPGVRIAVDKWHLVALANQALTEVRQRLTRDQLGRRVPPGIRSG